MIFKNKLINILKILCKKDKYKYDSTLIGLQITKTMDFLQFGKKIFNHYGGNMVK